MMLGTSSSESVLPRMMAKMENLGAKKSVVGLVIPTGYSFNLDATSIYLTMAAVFIAQATNSPTTLTLTQQVTLLAVLLLTSKAAAGVTSSGFIVLAATLSAACPTNRACSMTCIAMPNREIDCTLRLEFDPTSLAQYNRQARPTRESAFG